MNDLNRTTSRHPGRSLLLLGVFLALGGYLLNIILMLAAKILITAWYVPLLGTLGVALMILALMRSRSTWRWTAVVIFTMFVAFQWWALLAMRLPAYTGPVKDGQPFPAFATTLADGSAFTQADLQGDRNTVMVFFRGHWCLICMTELGQLEAHHNEFAKRHTRVVAVSVDNLDDSMKTQRAFPRLTVVADHDHKLVDVVAVLPPGGVAVPTTILVDKHGVVRALFRPTNVASPLSARELVAMVDKALTVP